MKTEDRLKILAEEVKNLQEIIKRMASNSLEIKKWAVTLIVGTMILKSEQNQVFVALIPLFSFWFLDSYYLRQEKLFRKKYEYLINIRKFCDEEFFDVNPKKYNKEVDSILRICFSVSTLPFYGCIFVILLSVNGAYGWTKVGEKTSVVWDKIETAIEYLKDASNKEKTNE